MYEEEDPPHPVAVQTPAPAPDISATVETWFGDLLDSLPQLRATEIYNALYSAKEDLKARLQPTQ